MPPTDNEKIQLMTDALAYMLYERREETELRLAFAELVKERHHHFHDDDEDVETDFTQCSNQACILALKMLQSAKEPKVEINQFSIKLVASHRVKFQQVGPQAFIVYLDEPDNTIIQPNVFGTELK